MKYIFIILLLFCSCKEKKPNKYTELIICGTDTIELDNNGNMDVSKAGHGGIWGHNDTINKRFITTFMRKKDTVYIHDTFLSIDYSKIKWDGYHYYKK